jgi:L-threonylcarbamoyladenylate synthase
MIRPGSDPAAIEAAVAALQAGHCVGLPTETVYGLAADATHEQGVARIFELKGRPTDHPLIVHVRDAGAAHAFARDVPAFARQLMAAHWPGPLTLILPRRMDVAARAAGGHASIGLRCPSHAVAQALLSACTAAGIDGLAAPSANRFGHLSPTRAEHVTAELGSDLLVLDGGVCPVGIESTIVDCTRAQPVLLRPGMLGLDELSRSAGVRVRSREHAALAGAAPRSSGDLAQHYAPRATLRLMSAAELQSAPASPSTPAARCHCAAKACCCAACRMTPKPPRINCLRCCVALMMPASN